MENKKNKIIFNLIKIFEILAIFLIILKTQSVFTFLKERDLHINILLVVALAILTFLKLINNEIEIKGQKKKIICLIVYIVYILIYAILTKCNDRPFFINYGVILPLMFINISFSHNFIEEIKNIARIYVNEIVIITIISLFFFIFGSTLNIIKPTNQVLIEWGNVKSLDSYCFLHFNTQDINILNVVLNRNSSIFTEAPMFALHLTIALALEVFMLDKKKRNIFLLVIGLCSTFTLTAFINIFIIYFLYLVFNYKQIIKSKKKIIINVIALIIAICGVVILLNARSNSSSLDIRFDDYKASMRAFKDNVFLGNGYNNEEAIKKYMSDFRRYNDGLSNSIAVLMAEGGIYFSLLYFVPILLIFYESIKRKQTNILCLNVIFVITMIFLIYLSTPLILMLLSMMYAYIYNCNFENIKTKEKEDGK